MPSSLVIAPCGFLFFPWITNAWKGKQFEDAAMIKFRATQQLLGISKTEYEGYFQQWKSYWNKVYPRSRDLHRRGLVIDQGKFNTVCLTASICILLNQALYNSSSQQEHDWEGRVWCTHVIEETLLFTEVWTSVPLGIKWFVLSSEL